MGKTTAFWTAPKGARRAPTKCLGHCGRSIVYGDRCPSCARELLARLDAKRRKRR